MPQQKARSYGGLSTSTRRGILSFVVLALLVPHGEVRRHASELFARSRTRRVCHQLCFSEFNV